MNYTYIGNDTIREPAKMKPPKIGDFDTETWWDWDGYEKADKTYQTHLSTLPTYKLTTPAPAYWEELIGKEGALIPNVHFKTGTETQGLDGKWYDSEQVPQRPTFIPIHPENRLSEIVGALPGLPYEEDSAAIPLQEKKEGGEESEWPLYGYAPGTYYSNCVFCQTIFTGDKMAVMCLECAVKELQSQLTAAREQIARLEQWKREATEVMPDFQEIGKLLNVKLGASVTEQIIPGIKSLQEQLKEKDAEIERLKGDLRPTTEAKSRIKIVQEYLDENGISFIHKSILRSLDEFAIWVVCMHIPLPNSTPNPDECDATQADRSDEACNTK